MKFSKKITKTIIAAVTAFAMIGTMSVVDVYAAGSNDAAKLAAGSSIQIGSNNITIENCEAGREYVISVVKGSYNNYSVTAGNIKYIDQKKAAGNSVNFKFNIKGTDRTVVLLSSNDENADYPIVLGEANVPIGEAQISFADATYTGGVRYAVLSGASYRGSALVANSDLTYSGSGVNVGTYTVSISGMGRFVGSTSGTFRINPVGTGLKSVSRSKKKMTVKWVRPSKKYKKQLTGYQIQYSLNPDFSNSRFASAKYKSKSKKIKGLAKKQRYYVRIRTYKGGYYSEWSAARSVVTK